MARTTVNNKFSREWIDAQVEWQTQFSDFDRLTTIIGRLQMANANRYVTPQDPCQRAEIELLTKEHIIEAFYRQLHDDVKLGTSGLELNRLRPNEMSELVSLAEAFSTKLKEMNITDHIEIYGVEANRRGRCFLSESRGGLPEEYEDE